MRMFKEHPNTPLVAFFAEENSIVLILIELVDQMLDDYQI